MVSEKVFIEKRSLNGLVREDVNVFGDLVVKANYEQLVKMSEMLSNERVRRVKRGNYF